MHDPQPQDLLEAIEIMISMQQFVLVPQAKSGDETIDGLANRVTALAQLSIILSGGHGETATVSFKNLELQQISSYPHERAFRPNTLQHFAKDEVRQPNALPLQLPIQPACLRILRAAQIIDPHRRVNDNHSGLFPNPRQARLAQISLPNNFPPKPPD
jgi:hypothetical protein